MPRKDHAAASEYQRQYYAARRDKKISQQREYNLKRKYGITLADYDKMLEAQGGVCALCGTDDPGKGQAFFCVDHCHKSGKVRSLLCGNCNVGLGHFNDSPALLLKAADYLRQHNGHYGPNQLRQRYQKH